MQKISSLVLATALAGAVTATALVPAASAHDRGFGPRDGSGYSQQMGQPGPRGPQMGQMGPQAGARGGMLFDFLCSEDGAERLETVLDNVAERLELTDEQTALFDTFKTAALTAQTDYAESCIVPERPQNPADVDLVDRLEHRVANMSARVEALESVLPALEAFYDSLTDEQKAQLMPGPRGGFGPGQQGPMGPGQMGPGGNFPGPQGGNGPAFNR